MKKAILILSIVSIGLCGCKTELVKRVELLSSIQIEGDSVHICRAQGTPFTLLDANGKPTEAIRIKNGDEFVLTDGFHISFTYRFKKVTDGSVILIEEATENTLSMGGSVETKRRIIAVKPYKTTNNSEPKNAPAKK
ncbi:MAG: hypothetical protein ACYS8I_13970 [Planctomycetota bacterium]|jgi:hypothetical protein